MRTTVLKPIPVSYSAMDQVPCLARDRKIGIFDFADSARMRRAYGEERLAHSVVVDLSLYPDQSKGLTWLRS
jgi:hypothetical protein